MSASNLLKIYAGRRSIDPRKVPIYFFILKRFYAMLFEMSIYFSIQFLVFDQYREQIFFKKFCGHFLQATFKILEQNISILAMNHMFLFLFDYWSSGIKPTFTHFKSRIRDSKNFIIFLINNNMLFKLLTWWSWQLSFM